MEHRSVAEGQLEAILKELLEYGKPEHNHEYPWQQSLLAHFHLLQSNALVYMRRILGCSSHVVGEIPSHDSRPQRGFSVNFDSLLEIQGREYRSLIFHSGYKIYVPLLQTAVELTDKCKIIKLLEAMWMNDKLELAFVAMWFVACLAAKRDDIDLVMFALGEVVKKEVDVKKLKRFESRDGVKYSVGEDSYTKFQRCLRPWRYTVLHFLVNKYNEYDYLFLEEGNLNWGFYYMAAFGSTKEFADYILIQNDKHACQTIDEYDAQIKCSPLEVAIYHDNVNAVKRFLQSGKFDVNIEELIQYAAMKGSVFSIKELLEVQRNNHSSNYPSVAFQQTITSISKSNVHNGGDIRDWDNNVNPTMLTPLQLAALSGHASIIKVLREKGNQDPNIKCKNEGETKSVPLLWLATQREDLFVKASCQDNKIDDWMPGSSLQLARCERTQVLKTFLWHPAGFTALHFAVVFGGTESVEALLLQPPSSSSSSSSDSVDGWQVDVCAEDAEGLSPYDWAIAVDEFNGNEQLRQTLRKYNGNGDLRQANPIRPISIDGNEDLKGLSEEMLRDKARALYERARKSAKARKQMEWVDWMAMAMFRRNWDEARCLAKRVNVEGIMDDDGVDDAAVVMLHAMEAARKTIFLEYDILTEGGRRWSTYTLLPNKIAAEEVLRELLRQLLLLSSRKVSITYTASECLSLAMKYGMEELAVDVVTVGECDVLSSGLLQEATDKRSSGSMPRLLNAMEQRKDVRRALYEERQVYVDYANTLLVGAALISALAYQGWLQPPMGYNDDKEVTMDVDRRHNFMLAFTYANNYGFTFSMGTMLAAAIGAAPLPSGQLAHTKHRILRAVLCASIFLACSVTCVIVAFTCAEAIVVSHHDVPPYPSYFIFNIAFTFFLLLWFLQRLYRLSFLQPLCHRVWNSLMGLFLPTTDKQKKSNHQQASQDIDHI